MQSEVIAVNKDYADRYGFKFPDQAIFKTQPGLNEEVVRTISKQKGEPAWMLELRLKALKIFQARPMPTWGADLSGIDFDKITYYIKPSERQGKTWEDVPENIRKTFERLGVPEAERKVFAGVGAMYESENVYHKLREDLVKQGVIFMDTDLALKEHEELFKKWFGKVVPAGDNKFAALNTAVWSGGSFIYVPPGVKVAFPLHAYFRINAQNFGQFERTLIIVDKDAEVHYLESCTAPIYSTDSLHAAVVEVVALPGSKVRYTTIQNWSSNVYNLVTKRSFAFERAHVFWVDANLGAKTTMKYPSVYLKGEGAKADILSVAFANSGQCQDAGGKVIHLAPNTESRIIAKSIASGSGKSVYRGLARIDRGAIGSKTFVKCDGLMLNKESRTDTYPTLQIEENREVSAAHEATVGNISKDKILYLMSRGFSEQEAVSLVVLGFVSDLTNTLPVDYAIEFNRLIQLNIEELGAIG